MKSILKRVEEITIELSKIQLKNLRLLNIKIAIDNPSISNIRIKGFVNENAFIDIFEFLFLGEIIKYSCICVADEKPILRYDNAPHHPEIQTYPHHKHLKDDIQALNNFKLIDFINEVIALINSQKFQNS